MAEQEKIRVALNGYGVIGKRVADAVASQDDMARVAIRALTGREEDGQASISRTNAALGIDAPAA